MRLLRDRSELVLVDALGVVQQPADQRRLAVVHAAGGGEAQQVLVQMAIEKSRSAARGDSDARMLLRSQSQKYPSRFFSSIEPSSS